MCTCYVMHRRSNSHEPHYKGIFITRNTYRVNFIIIIVIMIVYLYDSKNKNK